MGASPQTPEIFRFFLLFRILDGADGSKMNGWRFPPPIPACTGTLGALRLLLSSALSSPKEHVQPSIDRSF